MKASEAAKLSKSILTFKHSLIEREAMASVERITGIIVSRIAYVAKTGKQIINIKDILNDSITENIHMLVIEKIMDLGYFYDPDKKTISW